MDVITIKEITEHTSDYSDGEGTFQKINDYLTKEEVVAVSFEGLSAVTSAFINSALIRLLEYHSYEKIKRLLKVINSTRAINETIIERFEFVSKSGQTLQSKKIIKKS